MGDCGAIGEKAGRGAHLENEVGPEPLPSSDLYLAVLGFVGSRGCFTQLLRDLSTESTNLGVG